MSERDRQRQRNPVPEQVDVAIIGSGIGGLVAGAYLARRGIRVAVFESHYQAGGCTTQFVRGRPDERYHFDVGLHYIGDCAPGGTIPSILEDLGLELEFEQLDPDGFDTLVFPDFRFRIPADVDVYRDRLVEMFPHERRGIDRYIRLLKAVGRMQRIMETERAPGLRDAASITFDMITLVRNQEATIAEVLRDCVRDPKLVAVLLGQNGDYGLPPSKASAAIHFGLSMHYFRGAYYPKGGGQVLAERVAEVLEDHGGTIHLRRPVERILVENGNAAGIILEGRNGNPGETVRAKCVLSNADLILTLERLLGREHLPTIWRDRVPKLEMAAALYIPFLGIKGDLRERGMGRTNYWQFDSYDMEDFYADDPLHPVRTKGCYVTSASIKDPSHALHHAPAGVTNVEVMSLVPGTFSRWHVTQGEAFGFEYRDNAAYRAAKERVEHELVERLEQLFPGTRADIVYRESASPVTHSRFTRASGGTGYGLAATPAQFNGHRPGYRGPIPGLYLAGCNTRAGHGILGAMMGGRSAAKRVAKDLGYEVAPRSRRYGPIRAAFG